MDAFSPRWLHRLRYAPLDRPAPPKLVELHQSWLTSVKRYTAAINHPLTEGSIVPEQAWHYLQVASRNNATTSRVTVCETGFFRGVSTHLWLFANPKATVHSFDLGFPQPIVATLQRMFGADRLHTYPGSTRTTLKSFDPKPYSCDILSIDGGHAHWDPYQDLLGLLIHARCGTTVFFDDTFDNRATKCEI